MSEQDGQSLSCSEHQCGISVGTQLHTNSISSTCAEGADEGHKQLSKVLISAWVTAFKCLFSFSRALL